MNKIIYSLVYNRKKCLNKKGMALVQVEAYLDRKKKVLFHQSLFEAGTVGYQKAGC